jgi:hypothetical protein
MADGFSITPPASPFVADPDMTMLRTTRKPPALPLDVFGPAWGRWITEAAAAAACPPDYVMAPLLASASALIGNARWPSAPAWCEPPHLWFGVVGDSGGGKSPGADALMRDVLPGIEKRMGAGFADARRDWEAQHAAHEAAVERWKADVKEAGKKGNPPPLPPQDTGPAEPQMPRLRQNDVTIEKVASLLAHAAPKGLMIVRDELAGWFKGMNVYNEAGRAFWIEAYGGRPYRVERVKHPEPIDVPRLVVAVTGGTQPDKLTEMMQEADDGLLARVNWVWPDPVPFRLGKVPPSTGWATEALDRLRLLEMAQDAAGNPCPVMVRVAPDALPDLEAFAQEMQARQQDAAGLMRSAYGKARGTALRLSLVLQFLWWCGEDGMKAPPATISPEAFTAAAHVLADYLMPMAERVYGDAAGSPKDRQAATLARWIVRTSAQEVHVRTLQRTVRLPGLKDAEDIHDAACALVDAGWLAPPPAGGFQQRAKVAYAVNPRVHEVAP